MADTASSLSRPLESDDVLVSYFRNVSACNRCRLRKNRCDQRLPACSACEKAGVKCVGYDPVTRKEIPRSYVFFLETRVASLESEMRAHGIPVKPVEAYDTSLLAPREAREEDKAQAPLSMNEEMNTANGPQRGESNSSAALNTQASNIGMVWAPGTSDPRSLGSTSGVSFARVVFAAVKSSTASSTSEKPSRSAHETVRRDAPPSADRQAAGADSSAQRMPGPFFAFFQGSSSKTVHGQVPLPKRDLAIKFAKAYFAYFNPQIPILHRDEFMSMLNIVYAIDERSRTSRQSYMLFIVFAIGSSIEKMVSLETQCSPEDFHSSAMAYLEESLVSSPNREEGYGDNLEELQCFMLLAAFGLFRPIPPGVWYIVGVIVRLAVDLGLHHEDPPVSALSGRAENTGNQAQSSIETIGDDRKAIGKKEWVKDLRRRLFWCTYSFDRLIGVVVGRPLSLSDDVISTPFPSLWDDVYISTAGISAPAAETSQVSYKKVSIHFFRLRSIQSEIMQVFQSAQARSTVGSNEAFDVRKFSDWQLPFPTKFVSFQSWRTDVDRRLWEWKSNVLATRESGVKLTAEIFELEYWKSILMVYSQWLRMAEDVAPERASSAPTPDTISRSPYTIEFKEDEDRCFLKVAEASQKMLRLYRQLRRVNLLFYPFLDTHFVFIAGISFLFSIWHSPLVRSRLTMDEVDFTILACTSVLEDLIDGCPPAEACRDAFGRMSKATVQMTMSTTGFSSSMKPATRSRPNSDIPSSTAAAEQSRKRSASGSPPPRPPRPFPAFEVNLDSLFPDTYAGSQSAAFLPNLESVLGWAGGGFADGLAGLEDQELVGESNVDLFDGFFFGGT